MDVLASFFTLAGNTETRYRRGGSEISPFDLKDRIETAGRIGYTGMGFADNDLKYWLQRNKLSEVRKILNGSDISIVELEMLFDWWDVGEKRRDSDALRAQLLDWQSPRFKGVPSHARDVHRRPGRRRWRTRRAPRSRVIGIERQIRRETQKRPGLGRRRYYLV
jgi:hypothetical protein